jgi:DNA-binding CsgD family transcriptional regulator
LKKLSDMAQSLPMDLGEPSSPNLPKHVKRKHATVAAQIQVLDLAAKGVSQTQIAKITGISQQTVSAICARHAPTTNHALKVLEANAYKAASDWVRSFGVAVKRGEHRPMRDALIATGVIAADPQTHGITVIVGTGDVQIRETNQAKVLDVTSDNAALLNPNPHEPK